MSYTLKNKLLHDQSNNIYNYINSYIDHHIYEKVSRIQALYRGWTNRQFPLSIHDAIIHGECAPPLCCRKSTLSWGNPYPFDPILGQMGGDIDPATEQKRITMANNIARAEMQANELKSIGLY